MDVLTVHMARTGVKTLANIAFANAFATAMDRSARMRGIEPLMTLRYNPAVPCKLPQVLRLMTAKPDAVFIAASGGPAVTPVRELRQRGYTGTIYSNPGAASSDVLRLGGTALEGFVLATSPFFVGEQLPAQSPVKPVALEFDHAYETRFAH